MDQPARAWLRSGRPEEAASILNLLRDAGAMPSHTDDEPSLVALVERDPDALLVADLDGRIVGTLIATWTAGEATCTDWRCHPR